MALSAAPIRIFLLGRFEVARGERILRTNMWTRRKASALLQRLALERRLVKDEAIDFLWPEATLAAGANNLYRTLYALRRTLDVMLGEGAATATLSFEGGVLSLAPAVWVDVLEFERLCAPLPATSPEQRATDLEHALALYQGDLLPDDRYAEWTQLPRGALHHRQREARLELAGHRRNGRDYADAIALLTPLLAQSGDPADELVHRELMRLYALAGRRHEALRQYQMCVDALATELDVSPEPETVALYEQILAGDLSPPSTPAQLPWVPPALEVERSKTSAAASPFLPGDRARPPFVGRERELDSLHANLQAVLAGQGRIVFISGEAGQGKTSLIAEFAHRAQAAHPELVAAAGACQSFAGIADPYVPFRDLMAMLLGDWQRPWPGGDAGAAHAQRVQAIAPWTARAVAAYAPDLVDIVVPGFLLPQRPDSVRRDLNQGQVFDQLTQLLRVLAQRQPLLLLLDDLHWADIASTNLIFYLARQLVHSAVLIVGAYRPSELSTTEADAHPLVAVVQELTHHRGDIHIDLDAATPPEARHFMDAVLDSEPNRLDASFREAMFQRTNGHPLFTVELLRTLQEQGDLTQDEAGMWTVAPDLDWGILPARVEAVIASRVGRLPQELRQLLAVASVEGENFSAEVVAQIQRMDIRPLLHQLSQELDRRHRLVRELGETNLGPQAVSRFQFRHNLFQQYLYHQLGIAERRHLHGEVAVALQQVGGKNVGDLAAVLAHHYLAAGDPTQAVPHLCRAGDEARRRVALEEAIQFYQLALTHWQVEDAEAQAQVLHKLGESLLALGRSRDAIGRFLEAEVCYAQAGNRVGVGAIARLIGRSYWEQGKRAKALDQTHRALAILEQETQGAEMARAMAAIAQMHMTADRYDEALAWGERALALAKELSAEDVTVHALTTVGLSVVAKGAPEQGLAMLSESQERAEALGLPHHTGRAYTCLGEALLQLERYDQSRAVYERMLAHARRVHAEMFEGVALAQLGYLDWWTGRWGAALARCETVREWMTASGPPSVSTVWASTMLGMIHNDLGLLDQARAILAEYAPMARSAEEVQTTVLHLAQMARAAQFEQEQAALVQEMLVLIDRAPVHRFDALPALRLVCTWLARRTGGDVSALAYLDKAHAQMQDRQSVASLHEVRGVVAGIRGEWAQAVAGYTAAAANWEALERPYDLLRTLAGLGQALAHTSDTDALHAVQQQAAPHIEQLAAEIADPEMKGAFLTSPVVRGIRIQ
jgi:predicted ATPase/DNA-binding SARP family transcriptional activator